MSRYPYTDAYDALRAQTEYKKGEFGLTFSRSEAAQVCQFIAESLGIDPHELACKIADHAKARGDQ